MTGAKEVVASITSALSSAAVGIAVSKLIDNLSIHPPVAEKLRRLEMLLIQIHCAVEAAEKHNVENTWLLQWRDKLKVAASAGDEVLATFKQRAMDVQTTSNNADQQQDGDASSSSSSSSTTGAMYFTRTALSAVVQGICSASKTFWSSKEDMRVLSDAVNNLEQLSPDIGEFVRLLQVEISSNAEQRAVEKTEKTNIRTKSFKRVTTDSEKAQTHTRPRISKRYRLRPRTVVSETGEAANNATREQAVPMPAERLLGKKMVAQGIFFRKKIISRLDYGASIEASETREGVKKAPATVVTQRIQGALAEISETLEKADSRDLRGREWLASWADILWDAKKQGYAVLEAIDASTTIVDTKASEESTVRFDHESDELGSFVCSIESLASEVIGFGHLVCMCPPR